MGLEDVFASFCGKEKDMDGKSFVKMCKDCKLIDRHLTATDVDLIFAKTAPKGQRRINFDQFTAALDHLAAKKGASVDDISSMILESRGPVLHGTAAEAVRFHDDKSTYTGTHVNGGPESVAKGTGTATQLASAGMGIGQGGGDNAAAHVPAPPQEPRSSPPRPGPAPNVSDGERYLQISTDVFDRICQQLRTNELLGPPAAQALEEAAGVKPTTTSSLGAKPKALRSEVADVRESVEAELAQLRELNENQCKEIENLRKALEQRDEAIAKLHRDDDKSSAAAPEGTRPSTGNQRSPSRQRHPAAAEAAPQRVRNAASAGPLEQAFSSFTSGKPDMDQKTFVKLCKDAKLVDRHFSANDADLIFTKVVTKGQRRIDFSQFVAGLEQVATKKGTTVEAIQDVICSGGGPVLDGTVADNVRFHDDKSTYTGVHVNGGPDSVAKGGGTATQLAAAGMATGH